MADNVLPWVFSEKFTVHLQQLSVFVSLVNGKKKKHEIMIERSCRPRDEIYRLIKFVICLFFVLFCFFTALIIDIGFTFLLSLFLSVCLSLFLSFVISSSLSLSYSLSLSLTISFSFFFLISFTLFLSHSFFFLPMYIYFSLSPPLFSFALFRSLFLSPLPLSLFYSVFLIFSTL